MRATNAGPQDRSTPDKSRLAAIVESSSDAIISYTLTGSLDSWNHGAERLYGYTAAEAIGQPLVMLIPPHQSGEEKVILEKLRRGEGVERYETQRLAKDGRLVDVALTVSPIKNAEGALAGVSAVGHDIRDRKRNEAERSRLVDQLHDRVRELTTMYRVTHLLQLEEKSTAAMMEEIVSLLPKSWQYPEVAAARVRLGKEEFKTPNFRASRWRQQAEFTVTDGRKGVVEIVYLAKCPPEAEGPFLAEERNLIDAVAESLEAYWRRKRLESEILAISEREQRRIGQDLHDELGQHLAMVKFLSSALSGRLAKQNAPGAQSAARISRELDKALEDVRAVARGLHPIHSASESLMSALHELAASVTKLSQIPCRFDCTDRVLIHDHCAATNLYRIAQEAVNNAVRHGRPKRIRIMLGQAVGCVRLRIDDDGRGLPTTGKHTGGLGLGIMNYRAKAIGANFVIGARRGRGTVVTCDWKSSPMNSHAC